MSAYPAEYELLKHDTERTRKFVTSSRKNGIRSFPVFNTNIKTLATLCNYIEFMYPFDTYPETESEKQEVHQKASVVKECGFKSMNQDTNPRAVVRSDILAAAWRRYRDYDHAFVVLLVYILLLDMGGVHPYGVAERAREILRAVPKYIRREIFRSVRQIAASQALTTNNIYQQLIVLYGDRGLFYSFIEFIEENYPNEEKICSLFREELADGTSPIANRVKTSQLSSFKKEAYYLALFYALDEYVSRCKLNGLRSGRTTVNAKDFLFGFLDGLEELCQDSYAWLGKVEDGQDMEDLKEFIEDELTGDQREEIYRCIAGAFALEPPEEEIR